MRPGLFVLPHGRVARLSPPVCDFRPLIVFALASFLGMAFVLASSVFDPCDQWPRLFGFLLLLVLLQLVSFCVLSRGGRLVLDPFHPQSFYAIFFGAYYLLPFAWLILDPTVAGVHYVRIGCAVILAFVCFQIACRIFSPPQFSAWRLDPAEQSATLVICFAGMALLTFFYLWRLKNGYFYSHATNYTVGTDTTSSLLESLVFPLHLPVVLLLGLAAASPGRSARVARVSLNLFLLISFFLFLSMSQFRLAATLLPLGWVAKRLFRETILDWGTLMKFVGVVLCLLVLIFTVRATIGDDMANSENQFTDVVKAISRGEFADSAVITEATLGQEETASRVRAISPLLFFNDVIESLDSSDTRFGNGRTFAYELREVVPRLVWKNKPTFLSTQIFIRNQLGMSETDNSPHPMLQFYYEFGWPGIALGFFLMGAIIQYVVRNLRSMFAFMVFAFFWAAFVQVEVGIFLNLLIALRAAILTYIAWRIVLVVFRAGYGRSTAIATAFPPPRQRAATPLRASRRIIS